MDTMLFVNNLMHFLDFGVDLVILLLLEDEQRRSAERRSSVPAKGSSEEAGEQHLEEVTLDFIRHVPEPLRRLVHENTSERPPR
jgi:hypothetical protein